MNLNFVRWVDYWVGIPLTLVFSAVDAVRSLFIQNVYRRPRKILFIELSEMGSAIIAHSALTRAIDEIGTENVYFLIFSRNRESVDLLKLLPYDQVLLIDDTSFVTFVVSTLRTLIHIWRTSIDTVVDLELFSRFTALLSYATLATTRAGFHRFTNEGLFRGTFLNRGVLYNNHQHMALNFIALLDAVFSDSNERPQTKKNVESELRELPRLHVTEEIRLKANSWIAPLRVQCKKVVVINPHPGVLLPIRGWPLDHFVELVRQIVKDRPEWGVIVVGLPEAAGYAETMCGAVPCDRVVNLTGVTASLVELLALLEQSDLFITNDSGPAHFAGLVRTPTIVLFGPETPRLYGPLHAEAVSLTSGLSCSPCFSAYNHRTTVCTKNRCLEEILPGRVFETADGILSGLRVIQG